MIRPAALSDIPALLELETRCFVSDRLSRRSFRHMLTRARAACLVEARSGQIDGYAMLLFHPTTPAARLYSFAVRPERRGRGLGRKLLDAAERAAREEGRRQMRLEVRPDNRSAVELYRAAGFREVSRVRRYYEDGADALRMEKPLEANGRRKLRRVPYFPQSLDFTCGPSVLMMAMAALDRSLRPTHALELRLWREATSIFMTDGHGGCGPYGLAMAARRRGFGAEIFVSHHGPLFTDSVRSADKREAIRTVEEEFVEEAAAAGVPVHARAFRLEDIEAALDRGGVPIVLVSSARLYHERFPHWMVVTGRDPHYIYAHDSLTQHHRRRSREDRRDMPIDRAEFDRMARYGKSGLRAALIVYPRQPEGDKSLADA